MSSHPDAATPATARRPGTHVLVVISDDEVRARAVSALGLRGDLTLTVVTSIHDAAPLVADTDVLVVDGDLQPKGGYSWLYELREQAALHGTTRPLSVVLTERVQDTFLVDWSSAEAAVTKPVDPFELARTVAGLVSSATPS